MSSFDAPDEEWFDASDLPDSVAADAGFESANVCRVAALSTMLGAPPAFTRQVAAALGELGFSAELTNGDRDYRQADPFADNTDNPLSFGSQPDQARRQRWLTLNETGRPRDMLAFILAVLGSTRERESTAAATALWREVAPRINDGPRWVVSFRESVPRRRESVIENHSAVVLRLEVIDDAGDGATPG